MTAVLGGVDSDSDSVEERQYTEYIGIPRGAAR